ncbi:MAG: methylglyoxal synthase [Bacteroidales bacterium]|jgi:methylglyoxal synthase|nr:methylglyoxal synthase [Bacteroidales bacterium]
MKRKLRIALVAHDNRKVDIIDWVIYNSDFLSHHSLVCTGTTGTLVKEALASKGVHPEMQIMTSGPLGGDAEIAAMVVRKEIDLAVFLIDDLNAQPHEADIMMLLRQCRVHNIPIACNRYSADLMITTNLWDDESYEPMNPHYERFDREKHEANINKYK